jgi:hypothetical protein
LYAGGEAGGGSGEQRQHRHSQPAAELPDRALPRGRTATSRLSASTPRAGRQYRYHDDWRRQRDAAKIDRVVKVAARLPRLRGRIEKDRARPRRAGSGCWPPPPACSTSGSTGSAARSPQRNDSYGVR